MAKRKRLIPAQAGYPESETPVLETKSMGLAPIAQVAGDTSVAPPLQELAGEMQRARTTGRLIQDLPEAQIEAGYLVRDRMLADAEELRVLMNSLAARGQQTPIEVVSLQEGRYGLISGWRRLTALRRLLAETGEERFATVQAMLRQPAGAADAYVAMVEENEIRVGLSYYERARVAAKAVEQGVYETEKAALLALFSTASRAKRSKIRSFLPLYHALDAQLAFAHMIPERLGLTMAKALQADPGWAEAVQARLAEAAPQDAAAEIALLGSVLADHGTKKTLDRGSETKSDPVPNVQDAVRAVHYHPVPGLTLIQGVTANVQTLSLSGPAVNAAFRDRLLAWIKTGR